MCVYIYICLLFKIFFSIMAYHKMLNIVPCAVQRDLVYSPYTKLFASANPKLPILPFPTLLPTGNHKSVLYVFVSVSVH